MTLATTTNKVSYSGTTATAYPVGFRFIESSHLKVYQTSGATTLELSETTDYTVSGAGADSGGTVTLSTAPAASDTIVILRQAPLTQLIDYPYLDNFPSAAHEEGLDLLTMVAQQQQEELDRVLKAPVYAAEGADYTMPAPSAGRVIGVWNTAGDAIEIGPTASDIAEAGANAAAAVQAAATAQTAAALVPDPAGQAGKYIQVNSGATGWEFVETPGVKGYKHGLCPEYKDADELYLNAGGLEINGAVCTLDTKTALNLVTALDTAFANNTWYFFGFEAPSSGTALSSSELTVTATAPTYSAAKLGWYTVGGARIVNRFRTNGSGNIDSTSLWSGKNGECYEHSRVTILSDTTPHSGSIEYISAGVPAWGAPVAVGGYGGVNDGSTGSDMLIYSGAGAQVVAVKVMTANAASASAYLTTASAAGEIGHQGSGVTFNSYLIYKNRDWLPSGV